MIMPVSQPTSEVRTALHAVLSSKLPQESAKILAYHLSDLHGSFIAAARRIEELSRTSSSTTDPEIRRQLSGLMGELYEHMTQHLSAAHTELQPWIERLFDEADRRGEL